MVADELQQIKARMQNDIATRWAFLCMAVIMVSFLSYIGELANMKPILTGAILVVVLFNSGMMLALKKGKNLSLFSEYLYRVLDIALITLLIVFTGTINSPFYIMYLLIITMGGFSLNKKKIVLDFVISALMYIMVLVIFDYSSYLVSINKITYEKLISTLFVRVNFMALTAWMVSSYIDMVKKRQDDLARKNTENLELLNKVKDLNSNLELKIAVATKELAQKNKENEALSARNMNWFVSVLKLLSLTIEVRDPLIRGHAERVTKYSQAIWDELSSEFTGSQETRQTLFTACMMLDIGRQAMPEELLKKKTQLTPEEWAVMKKQPVVGAQIIKQVDELKHVSEIILAHRERFDGTGYPKGLKAESIPIESRILAVADVYDAMTTDRPFRPRKEGFEALEEIKRGMGTQFDPIIAQAFINAYSKDKIANR